MSCIYVRCALHELIIINCEMSILLVLMGAGPLSDCSGSQKVSVQIFQHIYLKLYSILHRLAFPLLSSKFLSTETENYHSVFDSLPGVDRSPFLFHVSKKKSCLGYPGEGVLTQSESVCVFSFEIYFTCIVFLLWGDDIAAVGGNWLITISLAT